MSYSLYEAGVQEHECIQKLFIFCMHSCLVQWPDDDPYSRSKQLLDSKHSQKSELCETENIYIYICIYNGYSCAQWCIYVWHLQVENFLELREWKLISQCMFTLQLLPEWTNWFHCGSIWLSVYAVQVIYLYFWDSFVS